MSKLPSFASIQAEMSMVLATPTDDFTEEQEKLYAEYIAYLQGLEADKVDAFWGFIKEEQGRMEAIKTEARRLQARAATIQRNIDGLKWHYLHIMQANGKQKIQGAAYTLSIRADKVARVFDEAALPEKFWKEKVERSVDKAAIKAAIKAGEEVPGAELVESRSLQGR